MISEPKSIAGRAARLAALADAYEPGNYALCDGVYHVYAQVPECCQTLRDDIRWALELALNQGEEFLEFKERRAYLRGAADERQVAEALRTIDEEGLILMPRDLAERLCQVTHMGQMDVLVPMLRAVMSAKEEA